MEIWAIWVYILPVLAGASVIPGGHLWFKPTSRHTGRVGTCEIWTNGSHHITTMGEYKGAVRSLFLAHSVVINNG
jgi:hypothetical protein